MLASSANDARFTYSSLAGSPTCRIFANACGVRTHNAKHNVSQIAQLSKSRAWASICAGVTRSGSST